MRHYRAATIGCGRRAPEHIEAYDLIENAEVVACCDPNGTRRDPLARKYGLAPYADPADMIRQEQPDIVHILTWPDVRVELMTLVAECRVPLCATEKPVATAVADWRALSALEAGSNTRFAVCHQFRWEPRLTRCRQALTSGALGEVLVVDMSARMNIAGQGTHTLDYGMSLNNDVPVVEVFGSVYGWDATDPGHPAPEATVAQLRFENGVRGIWTSGPAAPAIGADDRVWAHKRAAAYAERGRVNWEQFGRWEIVGPDGVEEGDCGDEEQVGRNHLRAQAEFHRAMLTWFEDESAVPGTNLAQSLHEWAVVLALYQSSLERRPIDLRTFDPPADLVERIRA